MPEPHSRSQGTPNMKTAVAIQNSAHISIAISIPIERSLILHSPTRPEG